MPRLNDLITTLQLFSYFFMRGGGQKNTLVWNTEYDLYFNHVKNWINPIYLLLELARLFQWQIQRELT